MDSILDKENYTLEELLDEEEIIQECKALNSRLIHLYMPLSIFVYLFPDFLFSWKSF